MKRAKIFAMTAMLALGLASCNKDTVENGTSSDSVAALSFSFDKPVGSYLTYADPIANDSEWAIESIDAYVFKVSDKSFVGKLTEGADEDYTLSVSGHTTTITMTEDWTLDNLGNELRFYFVANNATSTGGTHIAADWTGDEDAFKALTTKALVASTGADATKRVNIEATTSVQLLFSGVSGAITVAGGALNETVNLKRRVARFDIVNEIPTRFVINRVLISDAREKAYIMGTSSGTPADFDKVSMEAVNVAAMTPVSDAGIDTYNSVFYTYPTSIDDATTLTIMATLDSGAEAAWEIKPATPINIEANKRYKLLCKQGPTTEDAVIFQMIADDFETGVIADVTPKQEGAVTLGAIDYPGLYDNNYFYANTNATGVKVAVPVNSIYGTEPLISFAFNVGSTLNYTVTNTDGNPIDYTKSTVVSYAYGITEIYTFDLPVTDVAEKDMPFDIEVTFKSKAGAAQTKSIRFIRMTSVPAVENILAYDETLGLNLDGVGTPLYFRWGSLIGTDGSQPYTGADFNAATDVIFTPAGYTGPAITDWASIPYATVEIAPDALPVLNEATGLGDPCRLASKGGAGIGVGTYKMPEGNPYDGKGSNDCIWHINDNAIGATRFDQFYPIGGFRHYSNGVVCNVGRSSLYWSSTPESADRVYNLCVAHVDRQLLLDSFNPRYYGFFVRCISE